ncbi:MAG: HEPN domain-containing protein [Bryobacteraceae bacterium]
MTGRSEVSRLKTRLDATFQRGKVLATHADIETQSDFARYLCVLVSGYLEKAIAELVLEHARRHGGATLQRYVESRTRHFTNANCQRLKDLLGSFNPDWRKRLDSLLVDDLRDSVDSLVSLRHVFAHGGSAGITYVRVADYYQRIQRVVDEIADLCVP